MRRGHVGLMHWIGEKKPSWCIDRQSGPWSYVWTRWKKTMMLYKQIEWYGLFSPTLFMRPWTTLSVYTTSWSLLSNPIHETRDHSICVEKRPRCSIHR
jgi:hypothetical protein